MISLSWMSTVISMFTGRRNVRVLVHRAWLLSPRQDSYFINVTNLSKDREVEVTHVWLELEGRVEVFNPARMLPTRLRPDQSWETWISAAEVGSTSEDQVCQGARVRLSTGKVLRSKRNVNVPSTGVVPGA